MSIYLVRHGEAVENERGTPLTDKGIKQAREVAKALLSYKIDKVYSSDLERAKDTAKEYLLLNSEVEFVETEKLREIYRVLIGGPIKQGTREDRAKVDKKNADEMWESITNDEGNVCVFCHGNIIRYFLNKILKSKENLWAKMEIANASISIVKVSGGNAEIKEMNITSHLSDVPESTGLHGMYVE